MGLDRTAADAQGIGDVGLREVEVVAQREHLTLAGGQVAQGVEDDLAPRPGQCRLVGGWLLCLRVQQTPLTMSSTARCRPAAREKAALNSGSPLGRSAESVLRNVDGVPASGCSRRRESDEDERGPDRQRASARDAVAFVDARLLYRDSADPGMPEAHGLYDPALDKDSCGVGFIADIKGRKSHQIVEDALTILVNLEHRGAVGADPRAGDGAGILVQIPHKFFAAQGARRSASRCRRPANTASARCSCRATPSGARLVRKTFEEVAAREGLTHPRLAPDMPTDNSTLGEIGEADRARPHAGFHRTRAKSKLSEDEFERRLYILRKSISAAIYRQRERRLSGYYPVSISCRTVIYKGMFLADQLGTYYPDLHEPDFESALALVHQRFSTNTFPTWSLAHPYRMIAHNGEINTLRGNNNWMAARQASVSSPLFGDDINKLWPISYEGQSDTACFDNALEFLVQGGYSLAHAMMMMIPEAWAGNPLMDEERRAFYEYNAALMEPWDGPAAIAFTNGRQIGATLDRNGLRPARYFVTRDDRIIMASEMGVLPIPEKDIVTKWRLQPGKMLLVDLERGPAHSRRGAQGDARASSHPYKEWLEQHADRAGGPAGRGRSGADLEPAAARSPADVRLHAGRPEAPDDADGGARARKPSARWAPTRRSRRCRTSRSCCSPTSSRTSRR